jgi:hypothetical protein
MRPEEFGDDDPQEESKMIAVSTGQAQSTSPSFKDTQSASQMANTPQSTGAATGSHETPLVKKELARPKAPVKVAPRRGLKRL